jgi:hypothetical protein
MKTYYLEGGALTIAVLIIATFSLVWLTFG